MITMIAAITRDGALGRGGDMIYHIGADLRRFKVLTMGHPIVMGRRTYESFPNGPLPGRRNLVVSRSGNIEERPLDAAGTSVEVFPSLEAAIEAAGDAEVMVVGGGMMYTLAMPIADRLLITEIDADAGDADTYFPAIESDQWQVVNASTPMTDPRSGIDFRYIEYRRK